MNTPNLLDALFRDGHLRTLDHAFARSLRNLDPETQDHASAASASPKTIEPLSPRERGRGEGAHVSGARRP